MVWSTRPGYELPVLIITMNNRFGISTAADTQHGERHVCDRGKAFGIPGEVVDGNDPVASWFAIRRAMDYCRQERKPYMLDAVVSRLYGHSSSSGALRVKSEPDCIPIFEKRLLEYKLIDEDGIGEIQSQAQAEVEAAADQALAEPKPKPGDEMVFTYAPSTVDAVYPGDYTGLPN